MSLFDHFFKVLSLYLDARIRFRIRIKETSRIRIRNTGYGHGQALLSALVGSNWSGGNSVWRMVKADGPPPPRQYSSFIQQVPSSLKWRGLTGTGGILPWDVWLVRSRGRLYPLRPPPDPPPVQLCNERHKVQFFLRIRIKASLFDTKILEKRRIDALDNTMVSLFSCRYLQYIERRTFNRVVTKFRRIISFVTDISRNYKNFAKLQNKNFVTTLKFNTHVSVENSIMWRFWRSAFLRASFNAFHCIQRRSKKNTRVVDGFRPLTLMGPQYI
jgi:hypothetical protein